MQKSEKYALQGKLLFQWRSDLANLPHSELCEGRHSTWVVS